MPIYEYKCRSCGTVTDVKHGFDESLSESCPACGGELARLFSPAGIVFKGSGFYKTDSRKPAASQESKPSGDGKSSDTKSGDAKSAETKSEVKSSEGPAKTGSDSSSKKDGAAA